MKKFFTEEQAHLTLTIQQMLSFSDLFAIVRYQVSRIWQIDGTFRLDDYTLGTTSLLFFGECQNFIDSLPSCLISFF